MSWNSIVSGTAGLAPTAAATGRGARPGTSTMATLGSTVVNG